MATINLNEAMAWLKKMEEQSKMNQQRFAARPSVPASQAWSGYRDRPGGQRLMVRQPKRPEVDNTLTVKNDGTQTLVKKWKDPDKSFLRASGLGGSGGSHPIYQQPWLARKAYLDPKGRNQGLRDMAMSQEEGLFRNEGALSPEAQAAISQVQATGGQNVDAYGNPVGVDVSNQRAMYHALRRPNPQVVPSMLSIPQQTQQNIWGSRFVPNPAPMIRKERNAPPVGMDEEQWRFLLDRIYGGNN